MKRMIVLTLGLALASMGQVSAKDMAQYNKERMRGFYKDVVNAHKAAAIADYCTKDFRDHNPDPGQKQGMKGLQGAFQAMFDAFPDLHVTVEQMVAEGDLAVARVTMTGTQKGEYMGMPASGKRFKMGGIDIVKIKDGKATERWGYFDGAAMMEQLSPAKKQRKK